MFNLFKKNPETISRTTPGFEEAERRTPTVGIILLILMFIAGIYFGLFAMSDIANIPDRPASLSSCSYKYQTDTTGRTIYDAKYPTYYEEDVINSLAYENSKNCAVQLSPLEDTAGVSALFTKRIAIEAKIDPIASEYVDLQQQVNKIQSQIQRATGEYGVGLQEKEAGITEPVFPTAPSQQSIVELRKQEAPMLARMSVLKGQVDALKPSLDAVDAELVTAYKPVFKAFERAMRWYEFKVFLLQFLLLIPFFFLALRKYLELHRKNSPYTVILTTIVAVLGLLLLKTILFWFWGLFLEEILRVLVVWFGKYNIFRSLLFYFGMFFSFAIFGGAVYFLQKKIFDPRRVTIRRFRSKECPQCQTNLDLSAEYCPNCGAHIRTTCAHCSKDRYIGLPFCPHCGDKSEV
ncbi:MAG: hypothetical protein ACD_81C00062G0013 [uncultured bacterium]|uniref:DZANK-type domain-containing protein n=1 Tax=Candidatus Wolfebacteria bacterium GW2011_GWE2_44_13 TaxID=1619017 RepID=A0A0G1H9Q0_9BACT|nr:MAG: hypothetical protein ACD_81C00062G0013 [uncultured bacterium]KKT43515.1 MAG: hypothetical protein UW32_C0001G0107 [Candidatus Wolfebacteria bacterium GW2011_GWE2_44_13]